MDKPKLKFYFSKNQIAQWRLVGRLHSDLARIELVRFALLDNGKIVEYTEAVSGLEQNSTPHHKRYSDSVYLGEGVRIDAAQIDRTLQEIEDTLK